MAHDMTYKPSTMTGVFQLVGENPGMLDGIRNVHFKDQHVE